MIDINKAISEVIKKYKVDPLIIHSERDIQALLYNALTAQEVKLCKTNYTLNNNYLKTNRVHCEYQGGLKNKTNLIDIVVFSEKDIDKINHDNHLLYVNTEWGIVPCEALFQIKFENGSKNEPEKVKEDFEILRNTQEMHQLYNNIKPQLYFIYFIFYWKNLRKDNRLFNLLEKLPELSYSGEKVNTFLIIGPREIWEPKIKDLNLDIDKIYLDYTI